MHRLFRIIVEVQSSLPAGAFRVREEPAPRQVCCPAQVLTVHDVAQAPDRLRDQHRRRRQVRQAAYRVPREERVCRAGKPAPENGAPQTDPAAPDFEHPPEVPERVGVTPVVDHVHQARSDDAPEDGPDRCVENDAGVEGIQPIAPGPAVDQVDRNCHGEECTHAVPAERERSAAEDVRVERDSDHEISTALTGEVSRRRALFASLRILPAPRLSPAFAPAGDRIEVHRGPRWLRAKMRAFSTPLRYAVSRHSFPGSSACTRPSNRS